MKHSKLQKFISSLILFSLFLSITVRAPIWGLWVHAGSSDFYNLVSIIVDEWTYGDISSELNRYADDIQGVLENTRVAIFPTPDSSTPFQIASLNESLYFEWYKWVDSSISFESKLVWTILVGDLDVPVVYDGNKSDDTIVPYTDFEDKMYIYNHATSKYEKNTKNKDGLQSEIWHGVISPNLWSRDANIQWLEDYFDKNHDYYQGTGNFKFSEWILNGNKNIGVKSDYEPFVFYFDNFRENKALNYNSFQWYKAYLENKEDIVYNRFSKELADKVQDTALWNSSDVLWSLISNINPDFDLSSLSSGTDTSQAPDIQTRHIIEKITKNLIEIFSKGTTGDFRTDVHNAGRYNNWWSDVNVDLIPYFVTVLDLVNDQIIKEASNEIEGEIDNLVQGWLSRNIALPTDIKYYQMHYALGYDTCDYVGERFHKTYLNFLYGKNANHIENANECSIYRGSTENGWQLVEANRGLNVKNVQSDLALCTQANTSGYWGGNSPLNLDTDVTSKTGELKLKDHNLNLAIRPIFDISGAKQITDSTKIPSPLNCVDNNNYISPVYSCTATQNIYDFSKTFDQNYKDSVVASNTRRNIYLDGNRLLSFNGGHAQACDEIDVYSYYYKSIPSYVTHKSPTFDEISEQVKTMIAPNLPIDKNRFIDFISAKWNYKKINYPSLFQVWVNIGEDVNVENIKTQLDTLLDNKSTEINALIWNEDPSLLSSDNRSIYNFLKRGDYPEGNVDLLDYVKNKEEKELIIDSEKKVMSYYDALVFALYWNNLASVSAKYSFVFENYLTDQFGNNDINFSLPKNKKLYEVAYLWATWDASNMFVKLDPEDKGDNPYADIISRGLLLASQLLGSNVKGPQNTGETIFKCAPPDGVPISKWLPAVQCWIKNMLPAHIWISEWQCGWQELFLSDEEKETYEQCNGDVDKNGVNDCIENNLVDGVIDLTSDTDKYYYNKAGTLKAVLKNKEWEQLKFINATDIQFSLVKVEAQKDITQDLEGENTEVVFDVEDPYKKEIKDTFSYVYFTPQKIRTTAGEANYGFVTKGNDANLYFQASVLVDDATGNQVVNLASESIKVQVRWDRLFVTNYKLDNTGTGGLENNVWENSISVDANTNVFLIDGKNNPIADVENLVNNASTADEKLVLSLQNITKSWEEIDLFYPLQVELIKDGVSVQNKEVSSLGLFESLFSLSESGTYTIEITDRYNYKVKKEIELLPLEPTKIQVGLGSNIMETWDTITTNLFTLLDPFDNVASSELYNVDLSITGNGLIFQENKTKNLSFSTLEGFKAFRLQSTDSEDTNTLSFVVSDSNGSQILTHSEEIKTIASLDLVATPTSASGALKVWWWSYGFDVSLRDGDGNILSDFDSRIYLIIPQIYGTPTEAYVPLENGQAHLDYTTKTVAGENIKVEFQIEWVNKVFSENITILPEVPIKLDLSLTQPQIEASSESFTYVKSELKDRYGNLVFNDSSTIASLEILDKYASIISSEIKDITFQKWIATFKISASDFPGTGYFKISTNPSLDGNFFIVQDDSWELVISWVWESVGKVETFYLWNEDKIKGKKYNALYTTLLWANYGDIKEESYLAGSLLFERDNRALAVTSLLNNPYDTNDTLDISSFWNVRRVYRSSDLSQDIEIGVELKDNSLNLNLFNASLNTFIGNVLYNFDSNVSLSVCTDTSTGCVVDSSQTSIFLKPTSSSYSGTLSWDTLSLKNELGTTLLTIDDSGKIYKYWSTSLKVDDTNGSNYLSIAIYDGETQVGTFGFNFVNSTVSLSRDDATFESSIVSTKNAILVLLKSSGYMFKDNNEDTENGNGKILYYQDFLSTDNTLNSFSKTQPEWYENFAEQGWLGWKDGNKTLLAFSAGKSVWEAVKDSMSFSVINLWDPVVSLKKIPKKLPGTSKQRKFDATIGKLLSSDDDIDSYEILDYDNDDLEDIILFKEDNSIKLLENKKVEWRFIDKWSLASIVDLWSKDLIRTGDFTGDGYDDIFFVNNAWKPFLLNNYKKDFSRYSLWELLQLNGRILRTEVFDMDNNNIDDIVTLDDSGQINIFYGWGSALKPTFTKLLISDEYGIKLSSGDRNEKALLYFDGLYQLDGLPSSDDEIPTDMVDNILFERLSYEKVDNESTTFIRSEYSESVWLTVVKNFTDKNGDFLKSGDRVLVDVFITNTSNKTIGDIVYAEQIEDLFTLDRSSLEVSDGITVEPNFDVPSVHFLLDSFTLSPNDSFKISYEVKVKPMKFGHLQVWLFEDGELWDDSYGDIIVKQDNKNCSNPVEIFRSQTARSYVKWMRSPTCDSDAVALPDEIEKNSTDLNENGIPDYIDDLSDTEDLETLQEFAETSLAEVNNADVYRDNRTTDEKIDAALDKVDNIMQWLSCWFGGGWCIATPLNWAPLAPGWDPTLFWRPIWDGLKVKEWIPVFSALTGFPGPFGIPLPGVWPPFPWGFPNYSSLWAWGWLWVNNPANFLRVFVTPTLTGAVWTAICFWWPASIAWISMPKWLAPLVPGWNCIVAAAPIAGLCSDDGSDGNVWSTGYPDYFGSPNGWFGLINGNCTPWSTQTRVVLEPQVVKDYYGFKKNWVVSSSLKTSLTEALKHTADNGAGRRPNYPNDIPREPLFSLNGWWGWDEGSLDIGIDFAGLADDGDFSDIVEIKKKRISPFPGFLMDWVTRQIEEIVNKLTDFPTVFVIFPDFSGIFDGGWSENSWNDGENTDDTFKFDKRISNNEDKKVYDNKYTKWATNLLNKGTQKANSGIKEAYTFLSNVPLIKIEKDIVKANIPWIDKESIDKNLTSWWNTLKQWKDEWKRAEKQWKSLKDFDENNELYKNTSVWVSGLIGSLEKNIERLEEYKRTPEKLNKWFNKKEIYLEQVMCNVDAIAGLTGGWIDKNGQRFKAWVELYVLIKAILKSWQGLIDVFLDYEAECHECKNERGDLVDYQFKLIDMILPKFPIIQFPKWPDIVLDLHNIRAGLTITLPEFSFAARPILLPQLPNLILPDVPNVNINLPELAILPELIIPVLPDLPSLPTVELPNLPPPPKLPKMFASLEGVLSILKLVTKAMCILKSSPLVPEWRAWDQIAFMTERQWYLSFDFLDLNLPQFSFPFVDAIKVTSYVNFEFETEFITELARQSMIPLNSFTNNLLPRMWLTTTDLDFSEVVSADIDVNIDTQGWGVEADGEEIGALDLEQSAKKLSSITAKNITNLHNYLDDNKEVGVDNTQFKQLVFENLASPLVTSDKRLDGIRKIWDDVEKLTYSKEDTLIRELAKTNSEKFQVLQDILNTEFIRNREQKNKYQDIGKQQIIKVWYVDEQVDVELYNDKLSKYHESFKKSAYDLVNYNWEQEKELKNEWDKILSKINGGLASFTAGQQKVNHLLAAEVDTDDGTVNSGTVEQNSCQAQAGSQYRYNYEWLYVIEDATSYRLFDYLSELEGNEKTKALDYDLDSDTDLLYMVNNQLYLKENLNTNADKTYVSSPPLVLPSSSNTFYSQVASDTFYEAVNNTSESGSDSSAANIAFSSSTRDTISNYRLEFFTIVDRFLNIWNAFYAPQFVKSHIVDAFAGIDDITLLSEFTDYTLRENISYISNIWDTKWVKLATKEFTNIADNISANNPVLLSVWTKLYAGKDSFSLTYNIEWDATVKVLYVTGHHNIEVKNKIEVTWITGNAYIAGNDILLEWEDIRTHLGFPLFPGDAIDFNGNNFETSASSHIDIVHYDDTNADIDFRDTQHYEIYDLWEKSPDYNIRLDKENDFYYSKIRVFRENLFGTPSRQILLSPQNAADINSPELSLNSAIRIPVYQKETVDLTPYIYEDSSIRNIASVSVDFDLEIDSDNDGNPKNDVDTDKINIVQSATKIEIEFWEFDTLFTKRIGISLVDTNGNTWYREVDFLVYSPTPEISSYTWGVINGVINESLESEPINLYRYRWGVIAKLEDKNGEEKVFTTSGTYDFEPKDHVEGLDLKKDGTSIAAINEYTWKLTLEGFGGQISILSSNDRNNDGVYPKIILESAGNDIFYESLHIEWQQKVSLVDDFSEVTQNGIYVVFSDKANYNYYTIPEWLNYNPGSLSIYRNIDVNKWELFTIFRDGRVNTLNSFYALEYSTFWDYVVYKLMDKHFGREIAQVLVRVEGDYIMK